MHLSASVIVGIDARFGTGITQVNWYTENRLVDSGFSFSIGFGARKELQPPDQMLITRGLTSDL